MVRNLALLARLPALASVHDLALLIDGVANGLAHLLGCTAWRIELLCIVHIDNLDIAGLAESLCSFREQLAHYINHSGCIRSKHNRNNLSRTCKSLSLLSAESRRAAYERFAVSHTHIEDVHCLLYCREVEHAVAAVDDLFDAVVNRRADLASDSGNFADVLADIVAALRTDAADDLDVGTLCSDKCVKLAHFAPWGCDNQFHLCSSHLYLTKQRGFASAQARPSARRRFAAACGFCPRSYVLR